MLSFLKENFFLTARKQWHRKKFLVSWVSELWIFVSYLSYFHRVDSELGSVNFLNRYESNYGYESTTLITMVPARSVFFYDASLTIFNVLCSRFCIFYFLIRAGLQHRHQRELQPALRGRSERPRGVEHQRHQCRHSALRRPLGPHCGGRQVGTGGRRGACQSNQKTASTQVGEQGELFKKHNTY